LLARDEDKALSCLGFSDMYVALLRGSGIPARQVVGYSPSIGSPTSLHYWAEFYDAAKQRWVSVDSCLEQVYGFSEFDNLDLNRIILLYRLGQDDQLEVIRPFTQYQEQFPESLSLSPSAYDFMISTEEVSLDINLGKTDMFFRNIPLQLHIDNPSSSVAYIDNLKVDDQNIGLHLLSSDPGLVPAIFPKTMKDFEINLNEVLEELPNGSHDVLLDVKHEQALLSADHTFELHRSLSLPNIAVFLSAVILTVLSVAGFLLVIKHARIVSRKVKRTTYRRSNMGGMMTDGL